MIKLTTILVGIDSQTPDSSEELVELNDVQFIRIGGFRSSTLLLLGKVNSIWPGNLRSKN